MMNCQFYYKGQTVTVTYSDNDILKKLYESALEKFNQHFAKELLLFGNHLKFRIKRNNGLINFNAIVNDVLSNNDLIIIEPSENMLTSTKQNCHTPKRYDISNIENMNSGIHQKSSELNYHQTNYSVKSNKPMELVLPSKLHKYQKYEPNAFNNFDRNGLRRSLGAAFAPQYDLESLRENSKYFGSSTNNAYQDEANSSDSSISDIYPKASNNHKIKSKNTVELPNKIYGFEEKRSISKSAPASPTKPVPPFRSPHTHLSMMNAHNVRTIGNKINISILKKPNIGLGFTIVTRDNQVLYGSGADIANSVVILVNKILKNGGAADDGRLKPGDRILEVNSIPVSSLKDATDKLRAVPENTTVELLISRIEKTESTSSQPSSKLPKTSQLTFEISLNSKRKENQQLGLNIHYRNEKDNPSLGTGIYIHSILSNSLAAQQGGLQINDKLIGVNGHSLAEITVEETINLLKTAMQNNSVLAITVMRESSNEEFSDVTENNHIRSISNLANTETALKADLSKCILPNKLIIDNKSRKSKQKHLSNHNRNSSSDSCSQNEYDVSYSHGSNPFEREGKGRRSMSEKGKFHEDATQFEIYRRRVDSVAFNANERPYSTLPTTSHRKKMQQDQSPPPLPNKTPMKPSQVKIKSAQESGPRLANIPPNRSASLRDSPNTPNIAHKSRSPKNYSQTPTHDSQPIFNRAMNNSFKKAVQRSLPDANEQKKSTQSNNSLPHNTNKLYSTHEPPVTKSENNFNNSNPISNKSHKNEKIPRSNSVKNTEKKKSFNIKEFLKFSSNNNNNQSINYNITGKSDTFPPDKRGDPQLPNYQTANTVDSKYRSHSPLELPPELQYCNDQVIIDSTKRVLEWQKKNADAISKENKNKDKIYYPISSASNNDSRIQKRRKSKTFNIALLACCSPAGKTKMDMNLRNPSTKKSSNQYHCESDPYETIDGTLSSPTGHGKPKSSRSASRSVNNTIYDLTGIVSSTKNGAITPRSNSIIPYQINNTRKNTSIGNDIYATVNKPNKKESINKNPSNISQIHKNKYKF